MKINIFGYSLSISKLPTSQPPLPDGWKEWESEAHELTDLIECYGYKIGKPKAIGSTLCWEITPINNRGIRRIRWGLYLHHIQGWSTGKIKPCDPDWKEEHFKVLNNIYDLGLTNDLYLTYWEDNL